MVATFQLYNFTHRLSKQVQILQTCLGPNTQVMLSLTCSLPFVVTIIVFFPFSAWLLQLIRTPVLIRQYPCRTCTNFVNSLFILRRNSLCRTGKVENKFCRETVVPRSLAQGCFESNLPLWSYSSFVAAAWEEWCVTIESLLLRQRTKHQFTSLRKPPTLILRPHRWFPCKMMSEKQAQKFHTDDASLRWSK